MKQILLLISIFIVTICDAQLVKKDSAYFRSPVDFPIDLSGNFGELRNNHFHSGIDIRTGGEEGI